MTSDQDEPTKTDGPAPGDDAGSFDATPPMNQADVSDPPPEAPPTVEAPTPGSDASVPNDEPPIPTAEAPSVPAPEDPPIVESDQSVAPRPDDPTIREVDELPAPPSEPTTELPPEEPSTEPDEEDREVPRSGRTMLVGLSLLSVVLVGILIAVLATGGGDGNSSGATTSTTRAGATGPTLPAAAFTTFHDDLTGFTMQYPVVWQRTQAPVSEIRLAVTPGPGQGEAVSVRVNNTEQVTTPENLANVKAVTDGTIASNPSAKILKTDAITLNGLIGYYYLYTFKDGASGLEGVHAHYFLFKGHRMYSIVFQVLPSEQFARSASLFDQMAGSFKVDPEPPPTTALPASPTTTKP